MFVVHIPSDDTFPPTSTAFHLLASVEGEPGGSDRGSNGGSGEKFFHCFASGVFVEEGRGGN